MRVVFCPDSFKGSITAAACAEALAEGFGAVRPADDLVLRPMADGGEGTTAAFAAAVPGARQMPVTVPGPTGDPIRTSWLLLPDQTAVVDLASTSGIEQLDVLRPWDADTTGFGQAIAAALDQGAQRLVLGIGSSASTDGGIGMLTALGARFLDASGQQVAPGAAGLHDLSAVDLSGLRPAPETLVLSDVSNPLTGAEGAASVFGPQKGLTKTAEIARVDAGLGRLATLLTLNPETPGAGAAGGTGAALLAWGAKLLPGAAEVARLIDLETAIAGADLVVTGEGSFDGQSAAGKVPAFVTELAAGDRDPGDEQASTGRPVALVAGRITADADTGRFAATLSLTDLAGSAEAAMTGAAHWLRTAGASLAQPFG